LEPATTAGPNIAMGIPTCINNNDPPLGIILTTTDAYESSILSVSSTSGCNLGTVPLPCTWAPFKLMATTIRPSVNAELGKEEPTGKSRNRCMRTWRLPNTRRRVGVTKRREYSFRSCWRSNFHATERRHYLSELESCYI